MSKTNRVAILGAGVSGLVAIKSCLEEGLNPVCYEKRSDLGGLWNFTWDIKDGEACVMKSTVTNISKEPLSFSDFPVPKDFPNFMPHKKVLEYFRLYTKEFDLEKYIEYKTEIVRLSKADDFEKSGKWRLKIKDVATKEEIEEIFDSVMICTGHHAEKLVPSFPGEHDFCGRRSHTHDYKDSKGYEDKTVVVVGFGNSGVDAAVDLSSVCKQVYLSTRRGSWIMPRLLDKGMPTDMMTETRFQHLLRRNLPIPVLNYLFEKRFQERFDHEAYGIKPKHRFLSQYVNINDDLPSRIAAGTIKVSPNVQRFSRTGIHFDDGTYIDNVDEVIYATGYKIGFPFIDSEVLDVNKNKVGLYKFVFEPNLTHQTLAIIGLIQPPGAIMPIMELQTRVAARVFKGAVTLPNQTDMKNEIQAVQAAMAKRFVASPRHTINVEWTPYMDELASIISCKPNLSRMLLRDPQLAIRCFFDSMTPYQYRLEGPGSWAGARDAILTQWDRVLYPLNRKNGYGSEGKFWLQSIVIIVIICLLLKFFI